MNSRQLIYHGALALALSCLFSAAFAQTFAAPAVNPAPKEDTVVLSAFEVKSSRDYGYQATNSITATGIGTKIYDTPISISVITKDLINDLGATNLLESLNYSASVNTDTKLKGIINARGFAMPTIVNGIGAAARDPNSDFIERVEVVKGPNAVFFGRVAPGGVLNILTLRPKSVDETVVRAQFGSFGTKGAFLDHNIAFSKNFAVRLAATWWDRSNGYVDFTSDERTAAYMAVFWRLSPKVTLNINADYSNQLEHHLHNAPRYNSQYLKSGAVGLTAAQWAAANLPPGSPIYNTYNFDLASNRGRRFNAGGPDARHWDAGGITQFELIATPTTDLTLRLNGSYTRGQTGTMEISGFPNLQGTYVGQRGIYSGGKPRATVLDATAVYQFSLGPTKHRLLAGARGGENYNQTFSLSGNPTNYNYFTDGARKLEASFPTVVPTIFTRSRGSERAFYVTDQISLLGERLKVLAGARYTKAESHSVSATTQDLSADETTPQIGASFEVAKGLSVFANYAKTFEPQFQVDANGVLASNVNGEGKEAGFKADMQDGRLSATVSIFEVLRAGEARRDPLLEQALGKAPIFFPGASNRSRGIEAEFTWAPVKNYQAVLSFAHMWEATTIKDTNAAFIGLRLYNSPEYQLAFWNRYTFTEGRLKGWFVGLGYHYRTKQAPFQNPSFALFDPAYSLFEGLVGFERKFGDRPVRLQLNVKNLTNTEYMVGSYNPGDPISAYLSVQTRF